MRYCLLNRRVAQLRKMFMWCLHYLERKLMMMIMKLQIKLLCELHRSTRTCTAPEWYGNHVLDVMLLDNDEPTNYEEAMMSPNSDKWLKAMKSEIGSMYENKVWTLVDLPDDRQAIENKWIFKRK